MITYKVVFLIKDNNDWDYLFHYITHLSQYPDIITGIVVIVTDTAVLSCLKGTKLDNFRFLLKTAIDEKTEFWICNNTLHKYNIAFDSLIPVFKLAEKGGIIKLCEFQSNGYCYIAL